ncbi:MAG TPA: kelch repeat-containing protein, partial [Planctomycetota bacterium]|nr:kelch repeat-containing protein [Planctomycetota bacterium]
MSSTHRGHTATLLADERILVVGGTSANTQLATADIYDPAVNNWTAAPNMSLARNGHTATLMKNGKVLVAGGQNYNEQAGYAKSCEIFDPQSDTWSAASNMADRRGYHRDVLLPNGDVMVISGYWVGTCERYNPANNTWSTTARMASSRFNFTANVLTDGKVVLTGGYDGGGAMASVEEYDPMQNSWLALPRLITGRSSHASVVLNDGKLMVIGGHGQNYLATAEHLVPPPLPQTITFNSIP